VNRLRAFRDSRLLRSDSGLSLVEMLVAMMLSGILLAMVGTLFVTVAKATSTSNLTREAGSVAGNVANAMSKTIRFAAQNAVQNQLALDPAVVAGTPTALTLYSLADAATVNPAPWMVRYRVVGANLVEERWTASDTGGFWTFSGGTPATTRPLGGTIVEGSGIFTYLDSAGAELAPGAGGLTATQRAAVAAIKITVRVRSASSPDAPLAVVQNTVGMPNLAYSGEGD
jgi:prepilin-type N-terminal cleavage/methylation domain-containing protein